MRISRKVVINKFKKRILLVAFIVLLLIMLFPVWAVLIGSFMGKEELYLNTRGIITATEGEYARWSLLPKQPSLWSYIALLLDTPEYFVTFWNSVKVTIISVVGQMVVAVLAAWGISIYPRGWKKSVVGLYTILMMMPFQVFMLPQYFVLQNLHLYDSHWAVILPMIFSPFAVFLLIQNFKTMPKEMLEAARLDGAGEWMLLWKIGIPHARAGIITVMLLCFIECWSMVEQPGAFIENKQLMLLSEYLPHINMSDAGFALTASALSLIPCVLLVLLCSEYFEEGLGMKQ